MTTVGDEAAGAGVTCGTVILGCDVPEGSTSVGAATGATVICGARLMGEKVVLPAVAGEGVEGLAVDMGNCVVGVGSGSRNHDDAVE